MQYTTMFICANVKFQHLLHAKKQLSRLKKAHEMIIEWYNEYLDANDGEFDDIIENC